jgi:hypothetical protein
LREIRYLKVHPSVSGIVRGIIVTVVIISAIVLALILVSAPGAGLTVKIVPHIYSPTDNIAVLNEVGRFDFLVNNETNSSQIVSFAILAGGNLVGNQTSVIDVPPGATRNVSVSQEFGTLGQWSTKAILAGTVISSYSFEVVLNRDVAQIQLNQAKEIEQSDLRSWLSLVIAIIALVASLYFNFQRRRSSKLKESESTGPGKESES